jgi:hypothetical protein
MQSKLPIVIVLVMFFKKVDIIALNMSHIRQKKRNETKEIGIFIFRERLSASCSSQHHGEDHPLYLVLPGDVDASRGGFK